ncbi:hypothetical protein F2Q68_00028435 [Brassica cretica]|uniref:Cytochrome P450 n=1 Tax=Brassica cretica TaxID=69181 RepID=A0A8S9IFC0_BRACR|nr:hypothetical protein F2Q68_00028435 [Brassica cretica]
MFCFRLLRKLSVTHLFSPQRIEATKALRMKKVQELVKFMDESSKREEAVDISRASFIATLNIISNILFSVDISSYGSGKSNGFHDSIIGVMEAAGSPDLANFFPFLGALDLQGTSKKMTLCTGKLFKVFRGFIDTKTAEKSLRKNPKEASTSDFLDALLDEAEPDNNDIEHLLLDMFVAGTDTSSSTLEWAMAELLANPITMAKAQAEIEPVLKETLCLHPPVPLLLPRKAETDVEIFGYLVPKNAQVLVNVWAIGRDPDLWENPAQFEPERFLGKETDVKGKDYELTPFGAGRRICPGLPLAVKMPRCGVAVILDLSDQLLRKLSVTHLFSRQCIEATKALRMKKVQELVKFMDESSKREEAVDISRASFITTLNIISNILFSVDLSSYGSGKSNGFHDSIIGVMEAAGSPDLANFFPFLDLQDTSKKMKFCSEKLFKVFRGFIDTKTAEKSLRKNPKQASTSDFLDSLLDEAEPDNNDLEHLLLRSLICEYMSDMFVAGTDTSSSTLEWAMAELLANPKTMAKAQAEIERMVGQDGTRPEHVGDPAQFEPERFLGKETDVKGKDYELTPFGAGRRICPGLPLAVKMVSLMLVSLLYSFDWKLPNTVDMDETFGISLHKANSLNAVPVKKNRH